LGVLKKVNFTAPFPVKVLSSRSACIELEWTGRFYGQEQYERKLYQPRLELEYTRL
jgi:hypothetical protein